MTTSLDSSGSAAPMRRVSLRNLSAHKGRLLMTVLSVVLGTAFLAGSFVFTDTLKATFDGIFDEVGQGIDVVVQPAENSPTLVPVTAGDTLSTLPDVAAFSPVVSGAVVLVGADGNPVQSGGAPSEGFGWVGDGVGQAEEIISGVAPAGDNQVALNASAAQKAGLDVGSTTRVLLPSGGSFDITITGIYQGSGDTSGYVGVAFSQAQALQIFSDGEHVAQYNVAAAAGVTPEQLRDEISAALPDLQVQTGQEYRDSVLSQVNQALSFVNYILLAFAAIGLVVGTFIIYNTFSMLVAQRLQEFALLRAIGASSRQIGSAVLFEAFVIGLIGSVVGLLAGIGLAFGLRTVLNAFDLGLPSGDLSVQPRTIIVTLLVGIVVTMVSSYAPAQRASKIPPVAAMREQYSSTTSLRTRTIIGSVLGIGGLAAVLIASFSTGSRPATVVGIGAVAAIVGLLLVSPALSRVLVDGLGRVIGAPFGTIGRLARTNAVRMPKRTAATAFALSLGLLLVALVATIGASARSSVDQLISRGVSADFVLTAAQPTFPIPIGAAEAAADVPGVASVVVAHGLSVNLDGQSEFISGITGPMTDVMDPGFTSGNLPESEAAIILSSGDAADLGKQVGDSVTVVGASGRPVELPVTGIYTDEALLGSASVSGPAYDELTTDTTRSDLLALITLQPGADPETVRTGLEQATDPYLLVQVQDEAEFRGSQAAQIDSVIAILYGLLALTVIISILGIVNTLALSVTERRREIGMMRAVGTQRAQIRRTIYLESAMIAVYGGIVGVAMGLFFGWGLVRTLRDDGLEVLSLPWVQVVLMLVASGVVGVVAALLPAIRAARTKPLEAIAVD